MYKRSQPGRRKGAQAKTQAISMGLYPEDIERLDALVANGYAKNRTEAIRRSIAETAIWTLPR